MKLREYHVRTVGDKALEDVVASLDVPGEHTLQYSQCISHSALSTTIPQSICFIFFYMQWMRSEKDHKFMNTIETREC